MAFTLKRTGDNESAWVNIIVYGRAGTGKTRLIPTLPNPFIVSAENGLLSIRDHNLPYAEVASMATLTEVYEWLAGSHEAKQFESVAIDSISQIAEDCLDFEKKAASTASKATDPRKAYETMADEVRDKLRIFRRLSKHVYMIARADKIQDEDGRILYGPSMPGRKIGPAIPHVPDELFALRREVDKSTGAVHTALMCQTDGLWEAKDRSCKLNMWEAPDLGAIINKIRGNNV